MCKFSLPFAKLLSSIYVPSMTQTRLLIAVTDYDLGLIRLLLTILNQIPFRPRPFIRVKRAIEGWPFCNLSNGNEDGPTIVFSLHAYGFYRFIFWNSVGQTTNLMYQYWSKLNNFSINMADEGWRWTKKSVSLKACRHYQVAYFPLFHSYFQLHDNLKPSMISYNGSLLDRI